MDTTLLIIIGAIIVLILLSGFFSGSETALIAASRARIHRLAQAGQKRARIVEALIENRERLLGGILLGNNLVNILASALATSVMITFFGDEGVFYATLLMTALVLIFAEVLPKTYAIANPDRVALRVGPVIGLFVRLFAPVVAAVQMIVRATLRLFGVDVSKDTDVLSADEEIRDTIDLQASEGNLQKVRRDMLGSILDLDDVLIDEIMVHRKEMAMIDADLTTDAILLEAAKSPFTRLPLWRGQTDNIIGVLHSKDVLRAVKRAELDGAGIDIERIMSEPRFVPETTTLREQLNHFLAWRTHLALVVDEYGALMGMVTLEDILEEIVGEIADEFDYEAEGIRVEEDGTVIADGSATIRDINRRMDWGLPDDDAATIAGLVIHEAESIPIVGQTFAYFGFSFEILGRKKNQITRVSIRPAPTEGD